MAQTLGKNEQYPVHNINIRLLAQFTTCSRAGLNLSIDKDNSDKALTDHFEKNDQLYLMARRRVFDTVSNMTDETIEIIRLKEYQIIKPNIGLCYSMTMNKMSYLFEVGVHLDFRSKDKNGNWNTSPLLDKDGRPVTMTLTGDTTLYHVKTLPPFSLASDFSKGTFYQKVTLQYFFYENLYAHLALTTHLARADYLCVGIGYRFNQKYYLNKHAKTSKRPPGVR